MTSLTDREVSFTFQVQGLVGGSFVDLPAVNIIPSVDMDRVPFCAAQVDLVGIDYATALALDPRIDQPGEQGNRIRFRVLEFDAEGNFRLNLYRDSVSPATQWAELTIRSIEYDHITGDATLQAGGQETILEDRRRIATNTIDTGATTVIDLVYWSLTDTFGSYIASRDSIVADTPIPAGDRRLMLQGESHNDLIEPELQAIGCRLYNYWGRTWQANERQNTPLLGASSGYPRTMKLTTYTQREGAPPNADPIIYAMTETFDRGGDYADGILIKYDTSESGGGTSYQRSGDGSNTRGRVIDWKRATPTGNATDEIVKRTKMRGRDVEITARGRLDAWPGQEITAYLRNDITVTANVRAVRWDIAKAEMTIRAQAGLPEE